MTTRSAVILTAVAFCLGSLAWAQPAAPADPPLENWTAPPYWTPQAGQHVVRHLASSVPGPSGGVDASAATVETALSGGLPFVPVPPCRLIDTRHGPIDLEEPGTCPPGNILPCPVPPAGYPRGSFAEGEIRTYDLSSSTNCTGLPMGVGAWSLEFQFVPATQAAFLEVWPYASSLGIGAQVVPTARSTMLGYTDRWTAMSAIIPAGDDFFSSINVYAQYAGDVIVQVNGYYGYWGVFANNALYGAGTGNLTMSGGDNVVFGVLGAFFQNTTGHDNTALGAMALYNNSTGSNNIAIGSTAGAELTTGNYNIDIGNQGVAGESNTMRIGKAYSSADGSGQSATYIAGIRGVTTGQNNAIAVVIDSNGQLGTVSSSIRFKQDVADMGNASSRLMELRPVTFHYKTQPDGPLQYGLIAEEVSEVMPELVIRDATGQIESVAYHEMPAMLLNELQKQQAQIADQAKTINMQQAQIEALVARLAALEARVAGK